MITQIANPIYDVVFKYLMEDNKIAKLVISSIIGEEIESLELRPQEHTATIQSQTVYRLDFAATIRIGDSTKRILIEIQKAKFSTDIMRFRKYVAGEYQNPDSQGMPIITIYFLGYALEHTQAPVIQVKRYYYDVVSGEEIHQKEAFIESLTHDSFIIQIPYLKEKRQTELLTLLSVFDQSQRVNDRHRLNIQEEEFPEKYQAIVRRLQRAIAEPTVQQTMDFEDEIFSILEEKDRLIFEQRDTISEQLGTIDELKAENERLKKRLD